MQQKKFALFLLRCGIASVFFYSAIASFITPDNWIGYFPQFLRHSIPQNILLTFFSVYELVIAFWLLAGKYSFYAALLSIITLLGIIICNINQLDVIFRDFAIILSAAALAVFSYKK